MTVIWWIRRDLRLADNTALHAAYTSSDIVIPLYILDPALLNTGRNKGPRTAWMLDGLRILDHDLKVIGSRLIIRMGVPEIELPKFASDVGATAIFYNRDYSPYATRRDQQVREALTRQRISVHDFKDLIIHEADETLTGAGQPFSVYSPYRKVWNTLPKPTLVDRPTRLNTPSTIESMPIPEASDFGAVAAEQPIALPGESDALHRLADFMTSAVDQYKEQRNSPALDGTSILSPYLRWGMISPRTCYWAAQDALKETSDKEARESIDAWVGELVWREFYYQVLARNPHVTHSAYRPAYNNIAWENDIAHFEAWKAGQTGYPIVDAAMRQMNSTGWMHNRCRMIVASFLCKDLLIDWRMGERYFMQRLLDGDLANNNGGWQWTAGTGTDAAPYFRVFNPAAQAQKFDPDGVYIRRWLPELSSVPAKYIHEPHLMQPDMQHSIKVLIGRDYPAPLVEHGVQRDRVLELYSKARHGQSDEL